MATTKTATSTAAFESQNVNDVYLNNLLPSIRAQPSSNNANIASHLMEFPQCFYSLKILFIATGFINSDQQSKFIKLYVYLYRICLLGMPLYVLGVIDKGSNPLMDVISNTDQIIVMVSFGLLILNVYITVIFCIRHFSKGYLKLLYHSLSVDLGPENDHCVRCITDKLRYGVQHSFNMDLKTSLRTLKKSIVYSTETQQIKLPQLFWF